MNHAAEIRTNIILVGGGHAHVHVLTDFAKRPLPGVQLTLVTREPMMLYSGMLPGVIAGLYTSEQAHIDLVLLAAATGAQFVQAEAVGIDRAAKRVLLSGQPPIAYDILSVDVGIAPALAQISGATEHSIAVKPIGQLLGKLNILLERCRQLNGPRRITVIGGGAGGVELLLSVRTRLLAEAKAVGINANDYFFELVTDGKILATHNRCMRAAFRRVFAARGIQLKEHSRARRITASAIEFESGQDVLADAVLVTTDAAAPAWFRDTGLALDPGGFLAVGPTLQITNDPDVFAVGDCAALATPREKAGVYAVRAGPPLAANLRHRALGEALSAWHPQRHHLALISTGGRYAVASRGIFKTEGAWLWCVKDWIDRRWVRKYQDWRKGCP